MSPRLLAARLMAMDVSKRAGAGATSRYWDGLYICKSWYADRLAPVRQGLVAANVPPTVITTAGIFFGAGAGVGLAVAALLAARLACANLDGGVARDGDRATPFGSVLNELGDRAAELAALGGCLVFAP